MKPKTQLLPPASAAAQRISNSGKPRIDLLLVDRGLATSLERAQALLLAGQVRVNGQKVEKPGTRIPADAKIELAGQPPKYASRGGLKLEGALDDLGVRVDGKVCLDVGSSTGGFTDCLLQNGARKVYAVDVTISQLDWRLHQDERVVAIERNARYLRPEDIGESPELITMDVSFISVSKVLPAIASIAMPGADFLLLIKPQFELEKHDVGKGGIVRDEALHKKAVERIVGAATQLGLKVADVRASRVPGAEGNQEFFLHARGSS
ncbi:MAG: TlyA family RNA methyltransferase [Candidatus Acidiferrales bacterium]